MTTPAGPGGPYPPPDPPPGPPHSAPYPAVPYPAVPYPAVGYPPSYGAGPQPSTDAVVALVLAVVSWLVCPIVPAVVALVLAGRAVTEIEASAGWRTGYGLVTAARIVAWVNLGLYGGIMAVGVVFVLWGMVASL